MTEQRDIVEVLREAKQSPGGFWSFINKTDLTAAADEITRLRAQLEWIPVSDRLPDSDGIYVVTLINCNGVTLCNFRRRKWRWGDAVIAWRPLPEPYQAALSALKEKP